MKRTISLLLSLALCLSLCACGGTASSDRTDGPGISVKGVFLLEPSAELDLSKDRLDEVQRYLLCVYDIENRDDSNRELSSAADSVTITFNGSNSYKQFDSSVSTALGSFLENCGYPVSTQLGTLWGGSEPVRMVAAFTINKNDVKEDCSAAIQFALSGDLKADADITGADIQVIGLFDGIFAVEDDPNAYQVFRSVKNRAQICKTALEAASQANHNKQTDARDLQLNTCSLVFSEGAAWGVSCGMVGGDYILSDQLPTFRLDSVALYDADLADKLSTTSSAIQTMTTQLASSAPDYDAVNAAQRQAHNTLIDILG